MMLLNSKGGFRLAPSDRRQLLALGTVLGKRTEVEHFFNLNIMQSKTLQTRQQWLKWRKSMIFDMEIKPSAIPAPASYPCVVVYKIETSGLNTFSFDGLIVYPSNFEA